MFKFAEEQAAQGCTKQSRAGEVYCLPHPCSLAAIACTALLCCPAHPCLAACPLPPVHCLQSMSTASLPALPCTALPMPVFLLPVLLLCCCCRAHFIHVPILLHQQACLLHLINVASGLICIRQD